MTSHHDIMNEKSSQEEGKGFLKALRELLGDISQETLARELGVSVVTVSRWERGVTPATFTVKQLKALIRLLRSVNLDVENLPDDLDRPMIESEGES